MEKKKLATISVSAVLCAALTVFSVMLGVSYHAKALGRADLKEDMLKIEEDNKTLEKRRDRLVSELASKTDSTDEKDELNKKILELKEDMDKADAETADTKSQISKLESEVSKLKGEVDRLNSGINRKKGRQMSFTDKTILCPLELDEGRYVASGKGTITVTDLTNSARISKDLSKIETNSYTFDLEAGETVTVRGTVILTELK